ncbi:G-type lectin S-receptor-like serine/threonine-protein kinase CES [Forsythia ovata]|uniref:Receptor-like serine/threonine-protein kinase n=1 Tax=Forsythia ovata TaxID=205694 RepID=A0ABD1PGC6_9LAMI
MSMKIRIFSLFLGLFMNPAAYADTILQGQQPIKDWESLYSANKLFRLHFFRPGNSNSRYLGIFYNLPSKSLNDEAVWVANRNTPIQDASGSLMIDTNGKLKITYSGGTIPSVFDSSPTASINSSATLQDDGNFVLTEVNPDGSMNRTLWQSFDYPTDTFLPGMKLGIDFRTGHRWSLTSWISKQVPSSGSFTIGGDPNGTSQLMIWWQGNVYWTSGIWRNGHFDNAPKLSNNHNASFSYISNENEKYLTYSVNKSDVGTHLKIHTFGFITEGQAAGSFGDCSLWGEPGAGCVRTFPHCWKDDDDFWYDSKTGDINGDSYRFDENNMSLFDCQDKCRQNCSCVAYASLTLNGTGCEIWSKYLSFFTSGSPSNREVYFLQTGRARKWWIWLVASLIGILVLPLVFSILCNFVQRKLRVKGINEAETHTLQNELEDTITPQSQYSKPRDKQDKKLKQVYFYSINSIAMATNNFAAANKLGEGGFGPVYKGTLPGGQEIAIKRLSRNSGQGLREFKNEILLIAKLQHTNLVRLLGCCIEGREKILVYEYMPNKSLDFSLFDPSTRELLNWTQRMNIIDGVAQGLLYLHKYSRLKVVHRDLKASNILLDHGLNPKISDFGMAKIFGVQESEANTNRIVGTYGYMSPEYAIKGIVSMKTDIFSFGVLLLEIVSGKKNYSSYHLERPLNLIGYAWELWMEGRVLEIMDSRLDNSSPKDEIKRCINVGLLCVQDHPEDRPSMTDVVYMLTKDTVQLPAPKQPAFFIESGARAREAKREISLEKNCTNELSLSVMEAR